MDASQMFAQFQTLQGYVGWTPDDARFAEMARPILQPSFPMVIDDFYREVERHEATRRIITGGADQISRLKVGLRGWIEQLLTGPYDEEFVAARFRVGVRHAEIGLDPTHFCVALSRMGGHLRRILREYVSGEPLKLLSMLEAIQKLLELDLGIINGAYHAEYSARLQRAERLATIGQVAGGIAHELRNPLNTIKTSVYYLLNARNPTPEKSVEHLQRIDRQVGLADRVITALNDFSRLPVPELQPISVRSLIEQAMESLTVPPDVEVVWRLGEPEPAVLADTGQVQIALSNLIRNAVDAMPYGGQLILSAEATGNDVTISVEDTGTGIAEEALHRIMEPLFSTKARGIGLGLAITRAIVEKHRGSLRVSSCLGQGTVFSFVLSSPDEDRKSSP